ncbi:MAG: autotransporter-associated beta strand repeat-containing protein [Verrucomicrobiaceae bacterium]|nr:autotransporter-associated beta strand repeat-containing protein [Verrucomicrobiaceae bacterium]
MKKYLLQSCRAITAAAVVYVSPSASADVTKADNTTALNLGGSYTGGVAPTGTDLLLIDSTLTAARTAALGGNVSVLGIAATSANALTINNTAGATLTIGASGITKSGAGGLTFNHATSLGGNITMSTGTSALSFNGGLTLTANQTWAIANSRINFSGPLTTGGNTLNISGTSGSSGIVSFYTTNTLGTEITFGTMDRIYVQGGTVTFNGTNNTNSRFQMFGGTANVASMGNLTGASSIGKDSAYVQSGATLNYTGNTFSSNKGFSRDNNGNSTINVTTSGQTLSMSGNLTTGTATATGGWVFGGAGNLTLTGVINNANNTTVTKNGAGTLTLGGLNTYAGTTTVTAGSLQVGIAGTGTTGTGAVTVQTGGTIFGTGIVKGSTFTAQSGSTVQAGDGTAQANYGTLNFTPASGSGTFDFQSGSSTILGLNPGGTGDLLSFNGLSAGTLNFNGGLAVTAPGYTPTGVEVFNLLDWTNISSTTTFASRFIAGSYGGYLLGNGDDNLGFDLPDISSSGYAWDISQFTTNGTISTVFVAPEPSRALLLMLGFAGFVTRRRRQ